MATPAERAAAKAKAKADLQAKKDARAAELNAPLSEDDETELEGELSDEDKAALADTEDDELEGEDKDPALPAKAADLGTVNRQGSVSGDAIVTATNSEGVVKEAVDAATGKASPGTTGGPDIGTTPVAATPAVAGVGSTAADIGIVPTNADEAAAFFAALKGLLGDLKQRVKTLEDKYASLHGTHATLLDKFEKLLGRLKHADTLHGHIDNLGKNL